MFVDVHPAFPTFLWRMFDDCVGTGAELPVLGSVNVLSEIHQAGTDMVWNHVRFDGFEDRTHGRLLLSRCDKKETFHRSDP